MIGREKTDKNKVGKMLEFTGQYAKAIVYNDEVEPSAKAQIEKMLNCPAFEGANIRIMSDVHCGAGCVIGFTSTIMDKIIPNVVGVDLSCGVLANNLGKVPINNFEELDNQIRRSIPLGMNVRNTNAWEHLKDHYGKDIDHFLDVYGDEFKKIIQKTDQQESYVMKSIASCGGGNHFVELGKDSDKNVWVCIHSGSRNFGLKIANYHQQKANQLHPFGELSWLEGKDAEEYIKDAHVANAYARLNRELMMKLIVDNYFGIEPLDIVESVHNYVGLNFIRKGAIEALEGQRVVIPWNMRDGFIVGQGKGNIEWNYSAPHGAGRIMGRGEAKRKLDIHKFEKEMEGIWSSCINEKTLDEAPMAYKDSVLIEKYIEPTITVTNRIKPIYNLKATDSRSRRK